MIASGATVGGRALAAAQRASDRLDAILDEAAVALQRVCRTASVTQGGDVAGALVAADGRLLRARAQHPRHLWECAHAPRALLFEFAFDLEDGDVVVVADPRYGSSRVGSLSVGRPVFVGDELLGLVAVRIGLGDLGGDAPGVFDPLAGSCWAEGIVVPPVKVVRTGQVVIDVLDLLELNSRQADRCRWDIRAAIAITREAARRIATLARSVPDDVFRAATDGVIARAEHAIRQELGSWRHDGAARARIDVDGGRGVIALAASAWTEDRLAIDFSASDDQRADALNCSEAAAKGAALFALKRALPSGVGLNQALLDAVDVIVRPGSLLAPEWPAASGAGSLLLLPAVATCAGEALAALSGRPAHRWACAPLVDLATPPPGAQTVVAAELPLAEAGRSVDGAWSGGSLSTALVHSAEELELAHGIALAARELDCDEAVVRLRNGRGPLDVRAVGGVAASELPAGGELTVRIGDLAR